MKRRFPICVRLVVCTSVIFMSSCALLPPPAAPEPAPFQTARAALASGDAARARAALASIPAGNLTPAQRTQYQLLQARIALAQNNPRAALAALPVQSTNQATDAERLRLRGLALFRLGQPENATQALVQRAQLLNGASARATNADLIWDGLEHSKLTGPTPRPLAALDPTTRGWVELATLVQRHASLQQMVAWQSRFPDHPAAARLQTLLPTAGAALSRRSAPNTSQPVPPAVTAGSGPTALLLPLTGPLANAAATVQRGVEAALANAGEPGPLAYDTASNPARVSASAAQAFDAGAGVVIGPLSKPGTASLNQVGRLTAPVIALNYLEPGMRPTSGLLQFGLSPNDEVRQIVADAARRGLHRVVALVPTGPRGSAMLAALRTRLAATGGTLLDAAQYAPQTTNFTAVVARLLEFTPPTDEEKAVYKATGKIKPFEERRRQDVDFVFISGQATEDRMIVAMLRYSGAIHLPVYATSEVSAGTTNSDIRGVRFCDTPWKLQPGEAWNAVRTRLVTAVGGQTQLVPLYALGLDAGRLAIQLRHGGLPDTQELVGFTGTLHIDAAGIVERNLVCAQMTPDGPQMLDGYAVQAPGAVSASVRDRIPPFIMPSPTEAPPPFASRPLSAPAGAVYP
ncbi:MAG: hypothetical protein EPN72_05770 [Nevskiaceae bacterium]|nr:MAG: hypothetical protein EPN63_03425 [Nevskiaceae bacterium]TBR73643.1 MAG: hypothetical protein EPN72_05770 [Nevskiaceae bacterium]